MRFKIGETKQGLGQMGGYLKDLKLEKVEWLTFMYGIRKKWVPIISWTLS